MERSFLARHEGLFTALLLWLAGFLMVWLSAHPRLGGPGLTWDESYYVPPFEAAAQWARLAMESPTQALSPEAIHAGWEPIHELPPVVKWIGAAFVSMGGEGWGRLAVLRLYPAIFFGASLVLIWAIAGRLTASRTWAWVAVAMYALHPRVAGHGGLAASETVFAVVNLLVVWVALHDLGRWRWRALLVAAVALAIATKVNGLVLAMVVAWWLGTRRVFDRALWRREGGAGWRADAATLVMVLALAPLLALVIWPWMWDDTAARIREYIDFIRHHAYQGVWFLGRKWNYDQQLVPWWYPVVIIHLVTPVGALVLAWAGIGMGVWSTVRRRGLGARPYLVALVMLAPLLASSLPATPKYDGERLFFPFFAPAAILTAVGLQWLRRRLRRAGVRGRVVAAAAAVALVLMIPVQRPNVDYYNAPTCWLAGGRVPFPLEQTYWMGGLRSDDVAALDAMLPPGARVKTLALHDLVFRIYQRWGLMRSDIEWNGPGPYDFHLIQTRRGLWGRAEWSIYSGRPPLAGWGRGVGGEPLFYLYDGRPP